MILLSSETQGVGIQGQRGCINKPCQINPYHTSYFFTTYCPRPKTIFLISSLTNVLFLRLKGIKVSCSGCFFRSLFSCESSQVHLKIQLSVYTFHPSVFIGLTFRRSQGPKEGSVKCFPPLQEQKPQPQASVKIYVKHICKNKLHSTAAFKYFRWLTVFQIYFRNMLTKLIKYLVWCQRCPT